MDTAVEATALSVNQRKSLAVLGLSEDLRSIGDRPSYEPGLAAELRQELDEALQALLRDTRFTQQDPMVVTKFTLATLFACEGHYLASRDDAFEWSIAKARGTVLHKVQQASITPRGRDIPTVTAVEQAIERLRQDPDGSLSGWLQERSPFEIAELTADVTEIVNKIRMDIPPLQPQWQPRPESRVRVGLCDRRCVLVGKVDLALGSPRGNQARTFILDYKSGGTKYEHADEMRFYALLETLRAGIPPWRTAVYYVDLGEWLPVDINKDALQAASRRLIDGLRKLVELESDTREPVLTPGPCSFCSARELCAPGKAHLASRSSARN